MGDIPSQVQGERGTQRRLFAVGGEGIPVEVGRFEKEEHLRRASSALAPLL